MNKKQLAINMASSIIAFFVNFGIAFVLTPIIIKSLGKEAYGFYTLGNQFVAYASIVTSALNSMASRFIAIKIHEGDIDGAKSYFSSVFFGNIILSLIFLVPILLCVCFLEVLLKIPTQIIFDVKLLWIFLFANFIINLLANVLKVATFATNKIYLDSIRQIESHFIKIILLVIFFILLKPKLWFLGFVTVVCTIYISIVNIWYTKKLIPFIHISPKSVSKTALKNLFSAGIWSSFNSLANVLNNGLDLLLINFFIGATSMGLVSISKLFPVYIGQIIGMFSLTFVPQLTKIYAQKQNKVFIRDIKFSMRIMSFFVGTVVGIFTVYGVSFYKLWVPNENAVMLQILTIFAILPFYFVGPMSIINESIQIMNKHKNLAISYFISGIINILIVLPTLMVFKHFSISAFGMDATQLSMFVVVGISSLISVVRNLTYVTLYGSKCLQEKPYFIYYELIKEFLFVAGIVGGSIGLFWLFKSNSWLRLSLSVLIMMIVAVFVGYFVLLNKVDRSRVRAKLGKLRRKK